MSRGLCNCRSSFDTIIAWFCCVLVLFKDVVFAYLTGLAGDGNRPTAAQIELRLIQSLDEIRNPEITFKAQPVTD